MTPKSPTASVDPAITQVAPPTNEPATPSASSPSVPTLSAKDLLAMLGKMSPEQKRAVAQGAVAAGFVEAPAKATEENGVTLADGRVRVTVTFDVDLGAQLKMWAEAQNETLAKFISEAMTAYVQADWQGMAAAQA